MKSKAFERLFWKIIALLHPLFFINLYLSGNWYSFFHDYSLGIVTGVISYCYMTLSLILASRIRYFDRLFGQDKLIRTHAILSTVAILLGPIHYFLKKSYYSDISLQSLLGAIALVISLLLMALTVMFMVGKNLLPHRIQRLLAKLSHTHKEFDYSRIKKIHSFFPIVLILIMIHVLLASSTKESHVRQVVFFLYGSVGIIVYLYRRVHDHFFRLKLEVSHIEKHINNIASFSFKDIPLNFSFQPGQFAYFTFVSSTLKKEEHPFTISSSPNSSELSITVKALGDHTKALLNHSLPLTCYISGPFGRFTPFLDQSSHVFIAAGIGITPFISMCRYWNEHEISTPITVLWSVKNDHDLIFEKELLHIANTKSNFTFITKVTQSSAKTTNNRINIHDLSKLDLRSQFYICGPSTFIKSIKKDLRKLGVSRRSIHIEAFEI